MLVDTRELFLEVQSDLLLEARPTVDLETSGLNPWGTRFTKPDYIIGVAVATASGEYYFPFNHDQGRNLPPDLWDFFRLYLSNPDRVFGGFNYKFDQHFLYQAGVEYAPLIEDAMLSAHLLNENEATFTLKGLGNKYIESRADLEEEKLLERLREIGGGKGDMWRLDPREVEPYACDDVRLTRALLALHRPALKHWHLDELFKQICYYSVVTARMEARGLLLDLDRLEDLAADSGNRANESRALLEQEAGKPVNVNSSKQVCSLLGLESSRAEILETLAREDTPRGRLAARVLECRGWSSVNSRYYGPYAESMDASGVLRSSLSLHGTVSGRLSSSKPNLQAVARATEVFRVKEVFVSRPGYTLISMDYSQAEMRLACHYSKEETMTGMIERGEDLHTSTAQRLGIPRDAAKRINFGVIYGIGAGALSDQLKISREKAGEYLEQYHQLYPGFRVLMRACEQAAESQGYIRMWTGRMRRYDEQNPTHKAMSNLIQGGVAEMMRIAILRAAPIVRDLEGFMLLQVHDQVLYEIPDDRVEEAIPVLRDNMEDFDFHPAMRVEVSVGRRWGDLKVWTPPTPTKEGEA